MKRANPRSTYLEAIYKQRPDIEALVEAGDEAVLRRLVELEDLIVKNNSDGDHGQGNLGKLA